jgi:hypothetical protein
VVRVSEHEVTEPQPDERESASDPDSLAEEGSQTDGEGADPREPEPK